MPDASDNKSKTNGSPTPEALKAQDETTAAEPQAANKDTPKPARHLRRGTYRPSHKATFLGLAVVVLILGINAAAIAFVLMKSQSKSDNGANNDQVTVNQSALDNLGVSRGNVADAGVQLTVGPAAKFNNKVQIASDLSVGGQLILNNKFSASSASLAQLEAGNTSVQQLNVNGASSLSALALRNDLQVTGTSHFQGAVTMAQLLTINNGLNVTGSMAVGGLLTVNNFHTSSLTVDNSLTIGGHVLTRGQVPSVSRGSGLSGADTVSMSGNDTSGTIQVNLAGGSRTGTVVNVAFNRSYSNTPHVVVSPVGAIANYYVSRSSGGFSIFVSGLASSIAFDYIVEE